MVHNISVRVDDEKIRELKKYDVNLSELVRKALDEELKRKRKEEIRKSLEGARAILASEDMEFYTNAVRETRGER